MKDCKKYSEEMYFKVIQSLSLSANHINNKFLKKEKPSIANLRPTAVLGIYSGGGLVKKLKFPITTDQHKPLGRYTNLDNFFTQDAYHR